MSTKNKYVLTTKGTFVTVPGETNDALVHAGYKYIRRERVGDKWRYWYKDDLSGGNNGQKTKTANLNRLPKQNNQLEKDPGEAAKKANLNRLPKQNNQSIKDPGATAKQAKQYGASFVGPTRNGEKKQYAQEPDKKSTLSGMTATSVEPNYKERMAELEAKEKKKNQSFSERVKDWLGADEAEAYSKADSEYKKAKADKAMSNLPGHKEEDHVTKVNDAKSKRNSARDKYKKTLMGALETSLEDVMELFTGKSADTGVETYQERMSRLDAKEDKKKSTLSGMTATSVEPNYKERMAELEAKEKKKKSVLSDMTATSVEPNYKERMAELEAKEKKKKRN